MKTEQQKRPGTVAASATAVASPWAPFRHVAFTVIWTATIVSNIGTWMYNAASSWLMTSLDAEPLVVSMVQVATSLPMFLFAIPAGALADIIDKRRFLLFAESATTLLCAVVAALAWRGALTPVILLAFTFLLGAASALTAPCWQSVVPELVPRQDLPPAVAANSVGINISRAVGPALGGVITAAAGIAAPFWINAASNLAIVAALLWWRSPPSPPNRLPAERLMSAMGVGIRHARYNRQLRATLLRGTGFFLFASAYWALLPLVARGQIAGGPELYGVLLGTIGAGALLGAFALPWLKATLGTDRLVMAAALGTAAALVLFGLAREASVALLAGAVAGFSWIAALASFNVSAQLSLPDWVRGRGLAIFVTVLFGAMTLGSVVWGQLATMIGLPGTHFVAAIGALVAVPVTWRWKLQTGVGADLNPSMHWPTPVLSGEIEQDRGPVMVTVEYRISPENREPFLAATEKLGHGRRRDGAYAWGIFEDAAEEGRYLETFLVESWLEHLRQHQRVTNADRIGQDAILRFHIDGEPKVTHFISAEPRSRL
jgi:predicted MFS family arabinose efflux permease